MQQHFCLQDIELSIFRTQVCEQHRNGTCRNADRCFWSHCESWQRRNPNDFCYSSKLCPDIEFVKKGIKMTLKRRCTRGRACLFSHSKEEELYHPELYKTKMCHSYPNCNRYYCPFAHNADELGKVLVPMVDDPCESWSMTRFHGSQPPAFPMLSTTNSLSTISSLLLACSLPAISSASFCRQKLSCAHSSQANGVIEAPSISRQDLSIEETRLYVEILMTILHLEGLSADEKVALCSSLRSYHIGTSISTFDTTTSTESSALPSNNEAGIGFVFTPIHGNLGIDYPFNRGFNKSSFGIDA